MRISTFTLFILVALSACTDGGKKANNSDAAAFFKSQAAWCTVDRDGKAASDTIDRFEEVYVFGKSGMVKVMGLDLDDARRPKLNSKNLPLLKELESSKFRVEGKFLIFSPAGGDEREVEFKKSILVENGETLTCFELNGSPKTTHCPCALPGAE